MKKKLIAALLTTAMLFTGLTGCGGSSEGGAQTGKTDINTKNVGECPRAGFQHDRHTWLDKPESAAKKRAG